MGVSALLKREEARFLLPLAFVCILSACAGKFSGPESAPRITLNGSEAVTQPPDRVIDSVSVQVLSVPDSVMFGSITTIKKYGRYLLLSSEYNSNSLLCFRDGVFNYHLSRIGSGPGEYIALHSFYADTAKNELVIFDRNTLKLIYNDLNSGEFRFERKTTHFFSNIESVAPGRIIYSVDHSEKPAPYDYVFLADATFGHSVPLLAASYQIIADATFPFNFTVGPEEILYLQPVSETLYRLRGDRLSPVIKFDFGKQSFPDELLKTRSIEEVEAALASGDYSFTAHLPKIKGNTAFFFFYTSPESYQLAMVDLQKQTGSQIKNVSETLQDGFIPWPKACFDGMYVAAPTADEWPDDPAGFWRKKSKIEKSLGPNDMVLVHFSIKPQW